MTPDPEAGQFLRRFVGPDRYGASKQNWAATQDPEGIFYVANGGGVLVYDGHSWETVPTANRGGANSIATGPNGRVFVGGSGEFGVLRRDSSGKRQYSSLREHVPEAHRSFEDINRTEATDDGVYFQSFQHLFRWNPETETIQAWAPRGDQFQYADAVRDTLYVNVPGRGLVAAQGDSLRLVPGGERFADRSVRFVVPHDEHGLLVGTFRGLFVREGDSFRSFRTEADEVIRPAWLYAGRQLRNGTIAIATIDRGLLLLGPDGSLRRHLSPRGRPVTGLYEDQEGGLWALLDGGLMRYEVGAPFTVYGPATGLEGTVMDVARHRGRLYAATMQGTYRLRAEEDTVERFVPVTAIQQELSVTTSWAVLSDEEGLFVATVNGVALIEPDGSAQYLLDDGRAYDLARSRAGAGIYAATNQGVRLIRRTQTGWTVTNPVPALDVKIWKLSTSEDGPLWAGTRFRGVYRVRGLTGADSVAVEHFDRDQGLPAGQVFPYQWRGQTVFGTEEGVMRFAPSASPSFTPLPAIEQPPSTAADRGLVYLENDEQGRTWGFQSNWGPGQWTRREGRWRWTPGALARLRGHQVQTVEPESTAIWFGASEGRLVRYVPESGWARRRPPVQVRRVETVGTDAPIAEVDKEGRSELAYDRNSVRFTYGTPSLVAPDKIEYQYRLEGQSSTWSDWTARTDQTYRALAPGTYTFAVRARLAYGDTTRAARYAFTVLPPWYRTWWAYGLYLLAAGGLIAGAVRWRTWQLRRRRNELEATVQERTREIEAQKERLEELDEAKSRFFANVSHEFRTPITLIQGPARTVRERLQRGTVDPEAAAEQLTLVEQNAGRLLRLVNQILGIARLDAGTYELAARPTDLGTEVERIARTFEPLAEREALTLAVETEAAPGNADPVYVDREALEHVVSNLLSNAIKFTPEGGRVRVAVAERPDAVEVTVADTGPGIPASEQAAVFDRFRQVDDTTTRPQEGAGIGLAFAADLVDLHGGVIDLESTEGDGTTVTVRFRRGREHLPDEQVAPPSAADEASEDRSGPDAPEPDANAEPDGEPISPTPGDGAASSAGGGSDESEDGKRVLVVDDNAQVRQYVRAILAPEFDVIEAANGAEGVAAARDQLPDVILADVMMPSVDGHEMTRRLKQDPETEAIPVIMVTARAGAEEEVEGLQVGADDYVTKPFDADVLRQRVEGVVALQERLRDRLREELRDDAQDAADAPDEAETPSDIEREARRVIREHLTDADFDAAALAEAMAMSRATLYRRFREHVDQTPADLITELRMEKATELLQDGEGSVTQVAYAVGYERLSSFSRAYREHTGQSPSAVVAA